MLTIKSRMLDFKKRQGEYYTEEDLTKLANALVKNDMINFRGNIGRGFTAGIAKQILNKLNSKGKVLVINDVTLHMANALTDAGYKPEDIYLVYGKWEKTAVPSELTMTYNIMKNVIENNVEENLNVIMLKELFKMNTKFDCVIANPPYGAIGANITKKIIDNVDFKEYANLLPANDYKRNKTKDLYNYQSDMEPINDGFADAAVTTHVARIHKTKVNNMTLDEFERSTYIDTQLDKYFAENSKRSHYAIDNHICKPKIARFRTIDLRKCFYTGKRDLAAGHLPYSKDTMSYKINFNLLTDHDEFLANSSKSEQALGNSGNYTVVPFNTDAEKDNLINFLYSKNGFRFITKLFTAINVDCYVVPAKYLPKVDWTRPWTVEEILADYGYDADEIQAVMDDLQNFKGMED